MQILAVFLDGPKAISKAEQILDYWIFRIFVLNTNRSILFGGEAFGLTTRR